MRAAALLVGCGRYNDRLINPLKFSSRDAVRVAECFERFCGVSKIHVLSDDATDELFYPTQANILGRLQDLLEFVASEGLDRILIFFSGHGVVSKSNNRFYFICRETHPRFLERTALDVSDLFEKVRVEGPAEIIGLLDTCRDLFTNSKANAANEYIPLEPSGPFSAIVYSCAPGTSSYESEVAQAGVFTEALLCELGEDGRSTTLNDLRARLPTTMAAISTAAGKPIQKPFFSVEEGTEEQIVLVDRVTSLMRRKSLLLARETRQGSLKREVPTDLVKSFVAIDFGTTKTLAAFSVMGGGMHLVRSPLGSALLETSVTLHQDFTYVIGAHVASASRSRVLHSFKRDAGSEMQLRHLDLSLSISDAIAMVLNSVRRNIEEELGTNVPPVVASYPVNFDTRQYLQLRRAFAQSGLTIKRMISEAAAAAIALQTQFPNKDLYALVLDMGGGTFDVAVVDIGWVELGCVVEIKAVDGDRELGGCDFDQIIHGMLNEAICRENAKFADRPPLPSIEAYDPRLKQTKHELNSGRDVKVLVGEREGPNGTVESCTVVLSPKEFATLSAPLITRMQAAIARAVKEHPFPWKHAPKDGLIIMLAGQGTRLTIVRRAIEALFPSIAIFDRLQENAVVTGLAAHAASFAGVGPVEKRMLLLDVYHRRPGFFCSEVRQTGADDDPIEIHFIGRDDANREFVDILRDQITIPTVKRRYLAFSAGANQLKIAERNIDGKGESELGIVTVKDPLQSEYWILELDIDANSSLTVRLLSAEWTGKSIEVKEPSLSARLDAGVAVTLSDTSESKDGRLMFVPADSLHQWLEIH